MVACKARADARVARPGRHRAAAANHRGHAPYLLSPAVGLQHLQHAVPGLLSPHSLHFRQGSSSGPRAGLQPSSCSAHHTPGTCRVKSGEAYQVLGRLAPTPTPAAFSLAPGLVLLCLQAGVRAAHRRSFKRRVQEAGDLAGGPPSAKQSSSWCCCQEPSAGPLLDPELHQCHRQAPFTRPPEHGQRALASQWSPRRPAVCSPGLRRATRAHQQLFALSASPKSCHYPR